MSQTVTQSNAVPSSGEPEVIRSPVPVWLFIALVLLLYCAMVYFDLHGGWFSPEVYRPYNSVAELDLYKPSTGGVDLALGRRTFENNCALCHGTDGKGKPGLGPPFVGSEWALGSPNRMIRIPQNGLAGPIKVAGQDFNMNMAPMGKDLNDETLAAVLSYIRTSWGNKASPITKEQVQAVRKEVGARGAQWTATELMTVPEK
jgi:mono/diheme cytochrome c family protein